MSMNALQAVLDKAAQQPAPEKPPVAEARPAGSRRPREPRAKSHAAHPAPDDAAPRHSRPVRDGKRFVGAHFQPEVARQLKVLAAEDGTTIQELLEQAVDLLFVKNGKAKIAELTRK